MVHPEIFNANEDFFEIHFYTQGYPILHRHNYIEFIFVVEGTGVEEINGTCYPLEQGTLSVILPFQHHKIMADEVGDLKYYCVAVSMDFLMYNAAMTHFVYELRKKVEQCKVLFKFSGMTYQSLVYCLSDMLTEFTNKHLWWEDIIKANLMTIFVNSHREIKHLKSSKKVILGTPDKDQFIWEILQYVYCHFEEEISLKQLSTKFNMNGTYISSRVKEVTGQNYYDFLTDLRLRHAMSLIRSSDMKLMEIAQISGYHSYRSFVRAFHKCFQKSPYECRNSTYSFE